MIRRALLVLLALIVIVAIGLALWEPLTASAAAPPPTHKYDSVIARDKFGVPHIFGRTDPEIARRCARITFLSDNRADLARVTTPTLVVQCSNDAIAPVAVGEYVRDALPNSSFVLLQATGHCPNLSAPQETVAAMRQFLDGRAA